MRTKTRATKVEINNTFAALNIMSGRAKTPDYIGYEREKQRLLSCCLSNEEYNREIKIIAEKYGV
jgi:hypothetical protein